MTVITKPEWSMRAARHRERVTALIGPYLAARQHGTRHPVIDFLFTYYPYRPAQLERWHPGYGVLLATGASEATGKETGASEATGKRSATSQYVRSRGYRAVTRAGVSGATVDPAYLRRHRDALRRTVDLLAATASRPAHLGCFGLHEWAMVYRSDRPRHRMPLRLGPTGTDAVVESMPLRCTHFDAYRFFTAAAVPRNAEPLSRERQIQTEQPGCLHATMDLYRASVKLMPLLCSDLLADTFELSYAARELDMRASPYDLSGYGYAPVKIETPAGRAQYVREQQVIAARGEALRTALLECCRELLTVSLTA